MSTNYLLIKLCNIYNLHTDPTKLVDETTHSVNNIIAAAVRRHIFDNYKFNVDYVEWSDGSLHIKKA